MLMKISILRRAHGIQMASKERKLFKVELNLCKVGFWIPDTFECQTFEVRISNGEWYSIGRFKYCVLCTGLSIQIQDQCIRKQDGVHFSGIQIPTVLLYLVILN